jgi:hypothetical protein
MPRWLSITILLSLAVACSSTPTPPQGRTETVARDFQARVDALDLETRVVTLITGAGDKLIFGADEGVKNLDQVKVGDLVRGRVTQMLAIEFRAATDSEKAAPASVVEALATAPKGEKPAGVFVRQVTAVFTIASIDRAAGGGELRDANGHLQFVRARDPSVLDRVKVGDAVVVSYTESLALEVVSAAS